jgi:hypothetical protein
MPNVDNKEDMRKAFPGDAAYCPTSLAFSGEIAAAMANPGR